MSVQCMTREVSGQFALHKKCSCSFSTLPQQTVSFFIVQTANKNFVYRVECCLLCTSLSGFLFLQHKLLICEFLIIAFRTDVCLIILSYTNVCCMLIFIVAYKWKQQIQRSIDCVFCRKQYFCCSYLSAVAWNQFHYFSHLPGSSRQIFFHLYDDNYSWCNCCLVPW